MRQGCRRSSRDESQFHERFGDMKIGFFGECGREGEVLPFAARPADAEKIRMPQVVCPRYAAEGVVRNGHRSAPDFFGFDDLARGPHAAPPPPVGQHLCTVDDQIAPLPCRRDFEFAVMFLVRLDRRTDEGFAHVPVPQRVSLLIHVEILVQRPTRRIRTRSRRKSHARSTRPSRSFSIRPAPLPRANYG